MSQHPTSHRNNLRLVVLNDSETFTDIEGCRVLTLTLPPTTNPDSDDVATAVKEARHLYKPGETKTMSNGITVTLDDWLDERLANDP